MFVNLQVMGKDGKSNLEEVVSIDSEKDTTPKIGENADTKEGVFPKPNFVVPHLGLTIP